MLFQEVGSGWAVGAQMMYHSRQGNQWLQMVTNTIMSMGHFLFPIWCTVGDDLTQFHTVVGRCYAIIGL